MTFLKSVGGLFLYVVAGLAALFMASWISAKLMPRAFSQTPTEAAGQPPPPPPPNTDAPGSQPAPPPAPAAQVNAGDPNANPTPLSNPFEDKKAIPPAPKKSYNVLSDIIEDYTYQGKEKRDPFQPFERPHLNTNLLGPMWPLQKFDLDQLKLIGIIWDVRNPKAMIVDPTGKGYVVRVNERIGRNNGYIARIREGEIIIVESVFGVDGRTSYQTKLLKLQNE